MIEAGSETLMVMPPAVSPIESISRAFLNRFGDSPQFIVQAPGRVNLIGEHTDYNDGFVLPMAIDRYMYIAGTKMSGYQVVVDSLNFNEVCTFDRTISASADSPQWLRYVHSVSQTLMENGIGNSGAQFTIWGNIPIASGLSSSAALEVATCLAFEELDGISLRRLERANLTWRAECEIMGLQCGIMDMFISSMGVENHALLLDTRSMESRPIRLPSGVAIVVGDTHKRRGLVNSDYNQRQQECQIALKAFQPLRHGSALRDYSSNDLDFLRDHVDDVIFRRARHVITENERTVKAALALEDGNLQLFGQLMNESHYSLRDDYEVSCVELNELSQKCRDFAGCYGSRMTGAGFGGCTVSLVHDEIVEEFIQSVSTSYSAAIGLTPEFHVCQSVDGASCSVFD